MSITTVTDTSSSSISDLTSKSVIIDTGHAKITYDVGTYVAQLAPYQVAVLKVENESVGMQEARKYFYGPTLPGAEAYHILSTYPQECDVISREWRQLQIDKKDERYAASAKLFQAFEKINHAFVVDNQNPVIKRIGHIYEAIMAVMQKRCIAGSLSTYNLKKIFPPLFSLFVFVLFRECYLEENISLRHVARLLAGVSAGLFYRRLM